MRRSEGRGFSPAVKLREKGALAPEAASFDRANLFMRQLLITYAPNCKFQLHAQSQAQVFATRDSPPRSSAHRVMPP
jgi:hypothetical protein